MHANVNLFPGATDRIEGKVLPRNTVRLAIGNEISLLWTVATDAGDEQAVRQLQELSHAADQLAGVLLALVAVRNPTSGTPVGGPGVSSDAGPGAVTPAPVTPGLASVPVGGSGGLGAGEGSETPGPSPQCECFEVPEFSCVQCHKPVNRKPNGWWLDDEGVVACERWGESALKTGQTLHHRGVTNWIRYGSAVEPGSTLEPNPDCPLHFPRSSAGAEPVSGRMETPRKEKPAVAPEAAGPDAPADPHDGKAGQ